MIEKYAMGTKLITTTRYVYAVVTKLGKVQFDTICLTRNGAAQYLSSYDETIGNRVRRIRVICECSIPPTRRK